MTDIEELRIFAKNIKNAYVVEESLGYCQRCGKYTDLRLGLCFDCVFPKCPLAICNKKHLEKTGIYDYRFVSPSYVHCTRPEGLCEEATEK